MSFRTIVVRICDACDLREGMSDASCPSVLLIANALLFLSLSWLVPLTFASSLYLWGLLIAVVHTCVLICYSILITEISILNLRKIPFTCGYPRFQTRSPLIAVGYLFVFIILASYLPEYEVQSLAVKWAVPLLYLPALFILIAIRQYRKNMLPMDKELIFEEPQTAWN